MKAKIRILSVLVPLIVAEATALPPGEVSYNGIRLTSPWPPKDDVLTLEPPVAPYLATPPDPRRPRLSPGV
jgi:hypothetical protein